MVAIIVSVFLGALAVLQGGLNREIAKNIGLSGAVLVNSIIIIFIATGYFLISRSEWLWVPEFLKNKNDLPSWNWNYLVPALCGFSFVIGIPTLIPRLGAVGVFVCIVVGQMASSLLWDIFIEHLPLDPRRLIGAGIALLGLVVSYYK